jgi:hypothetical protein
MPKHWKVILRYWSTSADFALNEMEVTNRSLRLVGPVLELLNEDKSTRLPTIFTWAPTGMGLLTEIPAPDRDLSSSIPAWL